ncbi:MAG: amidohydrolase family protein, partial [Fimbriimonadaceae bacterium]
VDARLHPMALIPMQDPQAAAKELRRAVKELGLRGAMLPSTGLTLHLGHEYYFPVYKEAAELGCVLAVHGGSNRGLGMDSFTNFTASHILHHPMPLAIALSSMVYHGVFARLPSLKVGFMEGGAAWLALILDRSERDEEFNMLGDANRRMRDSLDNGQVLIGCEGEDASLPYLIKRAGSHLFAFSSDYPHETDLEKAKEEIEETIEHEELSQAHKKAILSENARRFFLQN